MGIYLESVGINKRRSCRKLEKSLVSGLVGKQLRHSWIDRSVICLVSAGTSGAASIGDRLNPDVLAILLCYVWRIS